MKKNLYRHIRKMSTYIMKFDGGSRGNPGLCGIGAVLYKNNNEIWSTSEIVSKHNTNNFAEYKALISGLNKASELKIKDLHVIGDSQLVLNQVFGDWNVKNKQLKQLHNEASQYVNKFETISFNHVKRNNNKRADELANIAMDKFTIG